MTTLRSFAALFDEHDRILCVKRAHPPYDWTLPGGKLDASESPIEGLEREVREESGYRVRAKRLIGAYFGRAKNDLALLFEVESESRDAWNPDREIAEVGFFARDGLPAPLAAEARVRIEHAFARAAGVMHTFEGKPESA